MFISVPKTFHDFIKPLFYFNCFAGIGAFRQPNQSGTELFFMKLHTVLITLLNCTTIYITLSPMASYLRFDNITSSSVTICLVLTYANACISLTAPLLVWLQRKGLTDCLQQMPILDDTFHVVLGVQNEYKKQYIRLNCDIIGILIVTIIVAVWDSMILSSMLQSQTDASSVLIVFCFTQTLYYPILVMLLWDVNFCTFVRYLGKKVEDMNVSLLRLADKPLTSCPGERLIMMSQNNTRITPINEAEGIGAQSLVNDKHHLLREIRKVHLELCKLSEKINLAFGIQNLLSSGISFVTITGSLYTMYSAFFWENFTNSKLIEVISTAAWTSIYVYKIWIVNHSCWSVSNKAERTGAIVYELLNSEVDEEIERKINEFAVQMVKNPIHFDVCGFFTLDYTFVQGVIGSITTYLVILIQLSPAPSPTTSSPLFNVTEI